MAGIFHRVPQPDDDWQSAPMDDAPPPGKFDASCPCTSCDGSCEGFENMMATRWDWDEDPEPDYEREYRERRKETIQDFTDFGL